MNPDLELMVELQARDLELARLQTELAEAPKRVRGAELALLTAEKALGAVRNALAAEEKLSRGQESEISSQRAKIARLRRSLDGATSATQVAAFEHEIRFAEAAIAKLEDEEFASLERTEALQAESARAEVTDGQRRQQLASERARSQRVLAENKAQVLEIEGERRELRAGLDGEKLATYDRLIKAKGTAIAEALGNAIQGKCAACQMTVRPQRWQDLIGRDHADEIFACESCGRMLFWDPRQDTPKAWEAGDRLRRAQTGEQRTNAAGTR